MANKHAVLSASSSERWLNCPPSARLCENYEDKGSDYAAEGTDAHTLCEFRLKQALGMPTEDPSKISPGTTRKWRNALLDMPPMWWNSWKRQSRPALILWS